MSKTRVCAALAPDLIAAASGEAVSSADRVGQHIERCSSCRDEYVRYRAVEDAVRDVKSVPTASGDAARERLLARLADLRSRLVHYGVFPTPLGPVLIGSTEQGIALVEYVSRRNGSDSWLLRQRHLEPEADPALLAHVHRELLDYLAGRRTRLEWPLDLRFVRSGFQRKVLEATARVPYGAVTSYAGIASDIDQPRAVRAVAAALRRNPVPIVVPCHRIVGSSGLLVGYAGTRIDLKEQLLGVEGVSIGHRRRSGEVDRAAMYAWDRRDRTYCLPTCGAISKRPIGTVTLFASARQAEALGLDPCGDCRPDLHPL